MKKSATSTLLACILALLSGCMATPMSEEERERQARAEEQRRIDVINRGR
jgi:starvation-inducible outer membrane lipoprotein